MNLIKGYWKSNGKIPEGSEEHRTLLPEPPKTGDYVAVYHDNLIVRYDIDDYSHKTGELEDPVHGKPRSEAVIQYLNDHNYQYVAIKTENGVHIIMLLPEWFNLEKNRLNWFCAMGIKIETHVTKVFEPLKVNGIERQFIKGNLTDTEIDVSAPALYPIQKGKDKPFLMDFQTGDRNNHLSEYAFYLTNSGVPVDKIREVITALNQYIIEDPLPANEIETILRPETIDKLNLIEQRHKNGTASPEVFKSFIQSLGMKIRYNELLNIVEYENIPISADYQNITDIQNVMPIKLMYEFRNYTGKNNLSKQQTIDLILLEADTHSYNPVKDFLEQSEWDGVDRFPKLFEILGVTDDLQKSLIRKWFYQTSGQPFNTTEKPFQAEGVLVLQGAEGIGKTRFFQQLAYNPMWFSSLDKELTTKNKDILIQMLSVWIAEIGEVDRTFKANKSDVKSFITSRDDTIRKPYRMEHVVKPRTTSFCGTTNKTAFLNDDTGSRRWWIIPVNKNIIMDDFVEKENLVQFWAQCYYAFRSDPNCFRLTKSELNVLKERNTENTEMLPSEEVLRNNFNFNASESEWHWVTVSSLRNLPEYDVSKYDVSQIGKALSAINKDDQRVKNKRNKNGRFWHIPPVFKNKGRYGNTIKG